MSRGRAQMFACIAWDRAIPNLSVDDLQKLMGNGMRVAQVGVAIIFFLRSLQLAGGGGRNNIGRP